MGARWNRRAILKRAAAGGAASALGCPALLAGPSPNSTLCTAVIGSGGRGEASLQAALGEKLVALVDVDDGRVAAAVKCAGERGVKPSTFVDYRRMFDAVHKQIDAVFVAAPDHHHAPASMIAIQLGKHVFCEKPLCHDVHQARTLAAAAKKHNVVTLMGNQGHCGEGYRRLCEYVWAGAIGDIVETHSWIGFVNGGAGGRPPSKPVPAGLHWDEWLGPAPYRDYHDGLHPLYWRYWWDFGTGGLGDWGCHNLDGAFWALKMSPPASVECIKAVGGSDEQYPQGNHICWTVPVGAGKPPAKVHWYDGGQAPPLLDEFEKKYRRTFREGWNGGTFYIGTKGVMHTASYGESPRILPEEAHRAFPVPPQRIPRVKGSHFDHFLRCCKSGQPTCADFQYAAAITEFLLVGHLAIKAGVGRPVHWDPAARQCTNLPELNRWLRCPCREGWNPGGL